MLELNKIYNAECLKLMDDIDDQSIDCIICDLPYGISQDKTDVQLPLDILWQKYKKIIKPKGAICLFGTEPFSSCLRMSNIKNYKYDWVWIKNQQTGFQVAKYRPMQQHEIISVFAYGTANYYPIKTKRDKPRKSKGGGGGIGFQVKQNYNYNYNLLMDKHPVSILYFNKVRTYHPFAKPVDLLEYLIKTYTLEGQTILDNCSGSGSLALACINTKRNYICIEKNKEYYDKSLERLEKEKPIWDKIL